MSQINCQYCQVEVSRSNLAKHQKTKACLKAQGVAPSESNKSECEYCHKVVVKMHQHQ